ncbi:gpW protein [Modicisalibacter muralis]|uniref:GpW protein n=1 Tax=Modicisalibacter muralis TaxID=119000 RepID=A0A1G9MUN6_9GAMM|nr:gpW family head-tail joining protein [Halomonas muralis]SDL77939.1 gpW protein [Halomonas muralis]
MAYTTDDLAQIRKAILDLASGLRVARVTKDGRTIEYSGSADLDKLREVERQIISYLDTGKARRTRTRYVTTSKGL